MLFQLALWSVPALLCGVSAQFVSTPTNLTQTKGFLDLPVRYKQVPEGICELTPGVKSYSGYGVPRTVLRWKSYVLIYSAAMLTSSKISTSSGGSSRHAMEILQPRRSLFGSMVAQARAV